MTLLSKSDQRLGEAFANQLLYRKVAQAATDKAVSIMAEVSPSPARLAFAELILESPAQAVAVLMPYVVQNASVQTGGGEITDGDLEFVVKTEVIDARYP
jgi:hypothetical protein